MKNEKRKMKNDVHFVLLSTCAIFVPLYVYKYTINNLWQTIKK